MSTRTNWIETSFDGDPLAAVKLILSSKSSGQIVLNVSQGTVCGGVVWREKKVETVSDGMGTLSKVLDNQALT